MRKVHRVRWMANVFSKATALTLSSVMALSNLGSFQIQAENEGSFEQTSDALDENTSSAQGIAVYFDGTTADQGEMDPVWVEEDQTTFTTPENEFVRNGYVFTGWSTTLDNMDVTQMMADEDGEHLEVLEKAVFIPAEIERLELPAWTFYRDINENGQIEDDEVFTLKDCIKDDELTLYPQWKKARRTQEESQEDGQDTQKSDDDGLGISADDLREAPLVELDEANRLETEDLMNLQKAALEAAAKAEDQQSSETVLQEETGEDDGNTQEPENPKAPDQEPEAPNPVKEVHVTWLENGKDIEGDRLVRTLNNDNTFYVRARADVAIQARAQILPGTLMLHVPKNVFRDRDGKPIGRMTLAVPEAPDESATFAYTETEEEYILTNTVKLPETSDMFFEFTIQDLYPHRMLSEEAGDQAVSDPFWMMAELTDENSNLFNGKSNELTAVVRTNEKLDWARVEASITSTTIPSSWPESIKNLANEQQLAEDEYFFVEWYAYSHFSGNQPFSMQLTVNPETEYASETAPVLLGLSHDLETQLMSEGNTFILTDGRYLSDRSGFFTSIYVAYPIPQRKAQSLNVSATISYGLTPLDTRKTDTKQATARASLVYEQFQDFGGVLNVFKNGIGGDRTTNPVYHNDGSYTPGKGYYSFACNDLMKERSTFVKYDVKSVVYGFSWTKGEGPSDQISSYGEKNYTVRTIDENLYFNESESSPGSEQARLKNGEYRISSLKIQTPQMFAYQKAETSISGYKFVKGQVVSALLQPGEYGFIPVRSAEYIPDMRIMVRLAGEDKYQLAGTVRLSDKTHSIGPGFGSINGSVLTFADDVNVEAFYTEFDTKLGGIIWQVQPEVELFGNAPRIKETMAELMKNSATPSAVLTNESQVQVFNAEDRLVGESQKKRAQDILQSAALYASMQKTTEKTEFNTDGYARVSYRIKVTEQTNITDLSVYSKAVSEGVFPQQTRGVFYDLLPLGAYPEVDSFRLRNADSIEGIEFKEDFNGTGRTLVKVKAKLKPSPAYLSSYYSPSGINGIADVPELSFSLVYSDVSALEFEKTLYNTALFISGDGAMGNAEKWKTEDTSFFTGTVKNQGSLDAFNVYAGSTYDQSQKEKTRQAMEQVVQNESTGKDFLVASAVTSVDQLNLNGVSGFTKAVSTNGTNIYKKNKTGLSVYENGAYTYRLSILNLENGSSKNIVLFDTLDSGKFDDGDPEFLWKGTLNSIDLSHLRALGINPVVYVSYNDGLNYKNEEERNLTDSSIWHKTDEQLTGIDKKQVKAIAIDATKTADGEEFELPQDKVLSVYLNMRAPSLESVKAQYEETLKNWDKETKGEPCFYAQNDAYVYAETGATTTNPLHRANPTRISLDPLNLMVQKTWVDGNNQDALRPDALLVQLMYQKLSGETVVAEDKSVLLSYDNLWCQEISGVTPVDENGLPYSFTFTEKFLKEKAPAEGEEPALETEDEQNPLSQYEELEAPDYSLSIRRQTSQNKVIYKLTNTHVPYVKTVSAVKIWDDDNNAAEARPDSVSVIVRNGKQLVRRASLSEENNWTYQFENLPVNRAGQPIDYTVEEEQYIPGYIFKVTKTSDDHFELTNTYHPFGNLQITVLGEDMTPKAQKNSEVSLTLELKDADGNPKSGDYEYELYDLQEDGTYQSTGKPGKISNGSVMKVKISQRVLIKNLPSEVLWSVSESHQDWFRMVKATSPAGIIQAGQTSESELVYRYQASGSAYLSGRKELTGHALAPYQFRFELYDENDSLVRSAYNDTRNSVNFGSIKYALSDYLKRTNGGKDGSTDYSYTMQETFESWPGYSFDTTKFGAVVTVEDDGRGVLQTMVQYLDPAKTSVDQTEEPAALSEVVFRNAYKAEGSVTIRSWKQLIGRDLQENEFKFELTDENGNKLAETSNNGDGVIDFIRTYSQEDAGKLFTYYVHEIDEKNPDYIYDTGWNKFSVQVDDNHNGTLFCDLTYLGKFDSINGAEIQQETGASSSEEQPLPVFKNRLNNGTLTITKIVEDPEYATQEFEFEIELSDPEGNPINEIPQPALRQETPFGVSLELLNEDGLGEFYSYTVEDPKAPLSGTNGAICSLSPNPIDTVYLYAVDRDDSSQRTLIGTIQHTNSSDETDADGEIFWSSDSGKQIIKRPSGMSSVFSEYGFVKPENTEVVAVLSRKAPDEIIDTDIGAEMSLRSGQIDGLNKIVPEIYIYKNAENIEVPLEYDRKTNYWRAAYRFEMADLPFGYIENETSLNLSEDNYKNILNKLEQDGFESVTPLGSVSYPWNGNEKITQVKTEKTIKLKNAKYLFSGLTSIKTINLTNINVEECNFFYKLFKGCSSLQSIDLSTWAFSDREQLVFYEAFSDCSSLSDVTIFKADKICDLDLRGMFEHCKALQSIDLTQIACNNCSYLSLSGIFASCTNLKSIRLMSFDPKRTTISSMCIGCTELESVDWKLTDYSEKLEAPEFGQTFDAQEAFKHCGKLKNLDLSDFNVGLYGTSLKGFLYGCSSLKEVDLSSLESSLISNAEVMFRDCTQLEKVYVSSRLFKGLPERSSAGMFLNCEKIKGQNGTVYDSKNTSGLMARVDTDESKGYFWEKESEQIIEESLTSPAQEMNRRESFIDQTAPGIARSAVQAIINSLGADYETIPSTDEGCLISAENSAYVNAEGKSADSVNPVAYVLNGELVITSSDKCDLDSLREENATVYEELNLDDPHREAPWYVDDDAKYSITKARIDIPISPVTLKWWFSLPELESIEGMNNLDTSRTVSMEYMFADAQNLKSVDLTHFDTRNVTIMEGMFFNTLSLTTLDISNFNMDKVNSMISMFQIEEGYSSSLKEINLGDARIPEGASVSCLFFNQTSLERIKTNQSVLRLSYSGEWIEYYNVDSLFAHCSALIDPGFKQINISVSNRNVMTIYAANMFYECKSITTEHVPTVSINAGGAFVDLSYMYSMTCFEKFYANKLEVNNSNNVSMDGSFSENPSLHTVGLADIDNINTANHAFSGCTNLQSVNLSAIEFNEYPYLRYMFSNSGIENVVFPDMQFTSFMADHMFAGCNRLKKIDLHQVKSEYCDLTEMFSNCPNLETVDLSGFAENGPESRKQNIFGDFDLGTTTTKNVQEIKIGYYATGMSGCPFSFPDYVDEDGTPRRWRNVESSTNDSYTAEVLNGSDVKISSQGTWVLDRKVIGSIRFDENGGTGNMRPIEFYEYGQVYSRLPLNKFYRIGYMFKGWRDRITGKEYFDGQEVTLYMDPSLGPRNNHTFEAIWEPINQDIHFQNGKATVILHGNESIDIRLPGGTRYKVTEKDKPGWILVSSDQTEGIVQPNKENRAKFVNEYQPYQCSVEIKAQKKVDGQNSGLEAFAFQMYKYSEYEDPEYLKQTSNNADGEISFGRITFTSPGVYQYLVREVAGSAESDRNQMSPIQNYEYDQTRYIFEYTVEDDGTGQLNPRKRIYKITDNPLTGDEVKAVLKGTNIPVFENKRVYTQLTIQPEVISVYGAAPGTDYHSPEFSFRIDYSDGQSETVNLAHLQQSTKDGLTLNTEFTITPVNIPDGFTLVTKPEELQGILRRPNGSKNIIKFRYDAYGSTMLKANKILKNGTLQANQFSFEVIPDTYNGNAAEDKTPAAKTTNLADGSIFFDLSYTRPGTYTYQLKEENGADQTINYDQTAKTVTVNVTDTGGVLKAEVQKSEQDEPTFNNTVKPGNLRIEKSVISSTEQKPEKQNFSFDLELLDSSGTRINNTLKVVRGSVTEQSAEPAEEDLVITDGHAVVSVQDGQYVLIQGLKAGTAYKITEQDRDGFALSNQQNAEGTILPNETITAQFTNKWEASTSYELHVQKELNGGTLKKGQFKFALEGKDTGVYESQPNEADGSIPFSNPVYTIEDAGKTFTYQIYEVNDQQASIHYDETVYELQVSVSIDQTTGLLNAVGKWTKIDSDGRHEIHDDQQADEIRFINYVEFDLLETGQDGIAAGLTAGAVMIGASAAVLLRRRKKDSEDAERNDS